jgi:acyl-coenzyme A thioesterase PaaI-like protein
MAEWSEDLVGQVGWNLPEKLPPGARFERRRLAEALRSLCAGCVTSEAPVETLRAAADAAERAVEALKQHPVRSFRDAIADDSHVMDPTIFADRSALIGRSNPIAPPMRLVPEGEVSVGLVIFGPVYEGAPGWVHGGFVSAAVDQVFGYAQLRRGVSSVTGTLTVRYRKPTPLGRVIRIEARFRDAQGRESNLTARILDGDRLLAEAEALFISIEPRAFMAKLLAPSEDQEKSG